MTTSEHTRPLIVLLAGRWTMPVLAELADGGRRYQDLDHALEGVSHKVLTATLRRLTNLGQSLEEPLTALERWSDINWPQVEAARRRWSRRDK
jgi:DNA-binding HxlR family transcriptional regulator